MDTITVEYRFGLPDGRMEEFVLHFEKSRFELLREPAEHVPGWVALSFHQCPNCTLECASHPSCPLAASIAPTVTRLDRIMSHSQVDLSVITAERRISQETTAQRALGSLMGLLIAASGCPHTAWFRPMARFHLPLSTEEETIYRVTSMYMLAQYVRQQAGGEGAFDIRGLNRLYADVHRVNVAVAKRLRAATTTDSSVNALILLDVFAIDVPCAIDDSLEDLQGLFGAYVEG